MCYTCRPVATHRAAVRVEPSAHGLHERVPEHDPAALGCLRGREREAQRVRGTLEGETRRRVDGGARRAARERGRHVHDAAPRPRRRVRMGRATAMRAAPRGVVEQLRRRLDGEMRLIVLSLDELGAVRAGGGVCELVGGRAVAARGGVAVAQASDSRYGDAESLTVCAHD
eukprot:6501619-Prymnesium_polylepis.1